MAGRQGARLTDVQDVASELSQIAEGFASFLAFHKTNRANDLLFEVGNSLHSASRLLAEYMDGEGKQRELWCIMETLDANAKKADECAALLGEVAELLKG